MVGAEGACSMRLGLVTASSFSLPPRTCPMADAAVVNMTCVSPPISPATAGPAPPLYGTWTMSSPSAMRSSSISSRFTLPLPGEP